ncbi:unnamed protein product [Mytilus edulis]|uniref:Uncharacterized protein n=1 Tax=Mytilus edulis TaxID=6550 RepID=A0A8S3V1S9_MYTED|nr:unnamed protein product [Mytilus edulis]
MYGSEFYVKAKPDKYPPAKKKGDKTEASSTSPATTFVTMTTTPDTTAQESTTEETTTPVSPYDRIPLTRFFDIDFMYEMDPKPKSELKDTQYVLPFPRNYTRLVLNEMLEFLYDLYGEESDDFLHDTDDFFERLSDSSLTLDSLYRLSNVTGLPSYVSSATDLVDLIGIDGYFKLIIDESGKCLMNYLGDIFDGFTKINSFDWNRMKNQEKYYLNWLEIEFFNSSACKLFNGIEDGTGSLTVTSQDVSEGRGFLVYLRVEFEESISYFIQHAQSDTGNPPVLDIETLKTTIQPNTTQNTKDNDSTKHYTENYRQRFNQTLHRTLKTTIQPNTTQNIKDNPSTKHYTEHQRQRFNQTLHRTLKTTIQPNTTQNTKDNDSTKHFNQTLHRTLKTTIQPNTTQNT